jgi:hypothetical protein
LVGSCGGRAAWSSWSASRLGAPVAGNLARLGAGSVSAKTGGLHSREAFVESNDGNLDDVAKRGHLGLGCFGSLTLGAAQRQWHADHENLPTHLCHKSGNCKTIARRVTAALDNRVRSRQHTSRIAHGYADTTLAKVDAHCSHDTAFTIRLAARACFAESADL